MTVDRTAEEDDEAEAAEDDGSGGRGSGRTNTRSGTMVIPRAGDAEEATEEEEEAAVDEERDEADVEVRELLEAEGVKSERGVVRRLSVMEGLKPLRGVAFVAMAGSLSSSRARFLRCLRESELDSSSSMPVGLCSVLIGTLLDLLSFA